MKNGTILASIILGCASTGCANGQANSPDEEPSEKSPASELTVESIPERSLETDADGRSGGEVSIGAGLQQLVDRATQDLGLQLGVDQSSIEVVEAQFVTWPDSSMGCARPGFAYTQATVNGSRILLEANKNRYSYHSGGNYPPFLCKKPTVNDPSPYGPGET